MVALSYSEAEIHDNDSRVPCNKIHRKRSAQEHGMLELLQSTGKRNIPYFV